MRNHEVGEGMMGLLRVEEVDVVVRVGDEGGRGSEVKSGEFVKVEVEVKNRLGESTRTVRPSVK